jgi:hypothetical protein
MNILLKTKIKYWFEYLRLAHKSTDTQVIANLESSKSFYAAWGNYLGTSFDVWWKEHSHLFRETVQMRRLRSDDVGDDDSFCIQFPFTYAPTTAASIFKNMYSKEFDARQVVKNKVKKKYGGSFSLTTEDIKIDKFRHYLLFTKSVYLPLTASESRLTSKDYLKKAEIVFKNVKKLKSSSEKGTIPFQTSSNLPGNLGRLTRRYMMYSENLLRIVSTGSFPGNYEEAAIKNQATKRKAPPPVRLYNRGVSPSRYINEKKRESGFDMYAKRGSRKKANVEKN